MNKSAIKNFAVRARNKLIEDVTQKMYELGITNKEIKEIEIFEGGFRIQGLNNVKIYKKYEVKQREKLISKIKEKGYEQVVEEVAYTWFNRFIALRFMEVNDYLPSGVRVLSSEEDKTDPDIIREALNIDFDLNPKEYEEHIEIINRLMDANDTDDLFRYLLVKQCNQLGKIMPMVFEEISDYTELLLPNNLLSENSVIKDLVESVKDKSDYKDQVEIIGWMYQYYISEKKDEVFADLKKNKKITKENIPAATQLFTPKWIVKYMVENSLGRLWLELHPDEKLKENWEYYLEEAEQEQEVREKLDELKNPNLTPEDIKFLDPACGSGHILVYAFDVLYDIYLKANYSERDIPRLILEKNLYGLDIDDRAGQLVSFALMMKARSKNRRIFRNRVNLNVCSIQESNSIPNEAIDYFAGENAGLRKDAEYLIEVFHDAKEYGSILEVNKIDFDAVESRIEEIRNEDARVYDLKHKEIILEKFLPLVKQAKIMSGKYDVVCTNPPYMGNSGMNPKISEYVKKNYPDSKSDLFAVFMEKCNYYTKNNFYQAMITQHSWMFLSSFEKLRGKVLCNDIVNMAHLGARAFEEIGGEVVQTTAFILRNTDTNIYKSTFIKLVNYDSQVSKEIAFNEKKDMFFVNKESFKNIPSTPIAYWVSQNIINAFNRGNNISQYIDSFQGIITGNNEKFLRLWTEVNITKIPFTASDISNIDLTKQYWIPYNKGGEFRKWYGNQDYIIYWKNGPDDKTRGKKSFQQYYLREYVSWSYTVSTTLACRYYPDGFLWDVRGSGIMDKSNYLYYLQGLINSKVGIVLLKVINSTLTCQVENILQLPILDDKNRKPDIDNLVKENIDISRGEWNSFEISWDFKYHPFLNKEFNPMYLDLKKGFPNKTIESAYDIWEYFSEQQFLILKSNEEELNRIFIDIYGLQDELTSEVEDKDITIRKADREREIKSFISYAVGCMFGRYSLDEEGLIYAGGKFDINRYKKFIPTTDNVLVMAEDDYFEEDIVNRFVEFVKITFGEEPLEKNLDYIAETLGVKTGETSRQAIRRYFLKDFYKDHVKIYQKRPIYWQFDSGKQNGFKALIYMHRYDSSTAAGVRVDYLHKLQKKYEAEARRLNKMLESDLPARDAAAAKKKRDKINKQIQECLEYDQVIAHVANLKINIDLDDGVAVNYEKFQNVEVPQGEGKRLLKLDLLAKI